MWAKIQFFTRRVSYSPTGMAVLKRSVMHHSPVFLFLEIPLLLYR